MPCRIDRILKKRQSKKLGREYQSLSAVYCHIAGDLESTLTIRWNGILPSPYNSSHCCVISISNWSTYLPVRLITILISSARLCFRRRTDINRLKIRLQELPDSWRQLAC